MKISSKHFTAHFLIVFDANNGDNDYLQNLVFLPPTPFSLLLYGSA